MDTNEVLVVGGGGRIGLPLAVFLSSRAFKVCILDSSEERVEAIVNGIMPFEESGCEVLLTKAIENRSLEAYTTLEYFEKRLWDIVIVVIGTQLLDNGIPDKDGVIKCIQEIHGYLGYGALLILRSTVYPGTTLQIRETLSNLNRDDVKIVFAPERIAEGAALSEFVSLPQIIGADQDQDFERANKFFSSFNPEVLRVTSKEAEIIKLLTNAYRFAHFALGNAIYLAISRENLDYSLIYETMRKNYPRLSSLPHSGYVGGPCLIKDTIQLQHYLGVPEPFTETSLEINNQLVNFTVDEVLRLTDRERSKVVGVLGITFKPESDDIRDSPVLQIMHKLSNLGYRVLFFDPYIKNSIYEFREIEELTSVCDIFIMGTPHKLLRQLKFDKPLINIWK